MSRPRTVENDVVHSRHQIHLRNEGSEHAPLIVGVDTTTNCFVTCLLDGQPTQFAPHENRCETPGLRNHPDATNLALRSVALENAVWQPTQAVVAATAHLWNQTNFWRSMVSSVVMGQHFFRQLITFANVPHCFSMQFRDPTRQWVSLCDTNTGAQVFFDLFNLTTAAAVLATGRIRRDGDVVTCELLWTPAAGANWVRVYGGAGAGVFNYAGDGVTVDWLMCGAQVETGLGRTPHIFTAGLAAASIAPDITAPGYGDWQLYDLSRPSIRKDTAIQLCWLPADGVYPCWAYGVDATHYTTLWLRLNAGVWDYRLFIANGGAPVLVAANAVAPVAGVNYDYRYRADSDGITLEVINLDTDTVHHSVTFGGAVFVQHAGCTFHLLGDNSQNGQWNCWFSEEKT